MRESEALRLQLLEIKKAVDRQGAGLGAVE